MRRPPQETVAKMRRNTPLPLCHATYGHSQMPLEGLLQQSPQQPDPRGSTPQKIDQPGSCMVSGGPGEGPAVPSYLCGK